MKKYIFLAYASFTLLAAHQASDLQDSLFDTLKSTLEKFEDHASPAPVLSQEELLDFMQQVLADTTIVEKLAVLKTFTGTAEFAKKYQAFCRVLAIICYQKFIRSGNFNDANMHVQDIKYVFGIAVMHILNTEFPDQKEELLRSHGNKFFTPFNISFGILFVHEQAKLNNLQ